MWTPEDRRLVGDYGAGQALSDDQYRLIEPLIPSAKPGGRPRSTDMRRLLDALFYVVRTGCQWRHLPPPPAFPPWPTVYRYFRAFLEAGVWEALRHHLVVMLREQEGRDPTPSAAILDTQSVKTTEKRGARGFDAAKKIKGRKRHIAVDTSGFLLGVLVHAADIQDADSAGALLTRIKRLYCWLRAIFADSIYNRMPVILACFLLGLTLIIVRRIAGGGFILVPRRWVVERSFGWLGRWRRLSKDYEERTDVAEAMVTIAAIRIMIHRLAHPNRKRLPSPDF
ncbi:IS5 family transposase [Azospirillum oryzae]|uniref:IS5 family transposase n=1 Tax=Azospirillum oryzae TaxID=286727 RepID=UPI001FCE1FAA|nr:IS5 family transposase [Azospirillum oryzae]